MNIPRRRRYPMRAFTARPASIDQAWRPYAPTFSTVEATPDGRYLRAISQLTAGALTVRMPDLPTCASIGRAVADALRDAE